MSAKPNNATNALRTFDKLPQPLELFRKGGLPGVSYLLLLTEQQADAQEEGWLPIAGMNAFRVRGMSATVMAKGEPIPGGQPGSVKCPFYVSKALRQACEPEEALTQQPIEPTKVETKGPKVPLAPKDNPVLQKGA